MTQKRPVESVRSRGLGSDRSRCRGLPGVPRSFSPIDAVLARLGRNRRIALVAPNFAGNVVSLPHTDLIMSLPSRLADSVAHPGLVNFKLPLAVPDYPYSIVWHRRTEHDPACSWLRAKAAYNRASRHST